MNVRILQPSKSAMQSGRGKSGYWVIEPELISARTPEPLMGWVGADDTCSTLKRLKFDNQEQAVEYARKYGWHYDIIRPHTRIIRPRNYSDKFQ